MDQSVALPLFSLILLIGRDNPPFGTAPGDIHRFQGSLNRGAARLVAVMPCSRNTSASKSDVQVERGFP
ncbi:hypothetical protein IFO70_31785 [Phormidium tenue FACHB-886]|nr:hypothetical protein [Phormidium tenue FACHB-886]